MTRSWHDAATRTRELRAVLGCVEPERTIEGARRIVAERDALRREVEYLKRALVAVWSEKEAI